ncbi:MAG TPA: hypothetical protein VKA91_02820 [Nitrososphaeraceae archaeon]|jgi:hypothetical protein|nr:hypothetical protein [Nitrososphaeraceae archaeon]
MSSKSEYGRKQNYSKNMMARIRIGESKHMKIVLMKMTDYEIESTMDDLIIIQSIADKFIDMTKV